MSFPTDLRTLPRSAVDPRTVFCARCTHSDFVHSDAAERRCLFSECACDGWFGPEEPRDTPAE